MIVIQRLVLCFVFLCTAFSCLASPTILIIGDSLSAAYRMPQSSSWVTLLEKKVKSIYPNANIINSSRSGDTTANGLSKITTLLQEHRPNIVILELGGNDGLRGYPPQNIEHNLNQMIQQSLAQGAKVLLIGMKLPPNYGGPYAREFENIFKSLSEQHAIELVPFFLKGVALRPSLMLPDRIHPNEQAQPILLDNVWKHLNKILQDQKF